MYIALAPGPLASPQMNEIERQIKFEADALQDGILRYCQTRDYALATDSKPVRDLVADALKPLAQAILQEQLALKTPGSQKLPRYGIPLLSISHEKLGLITLGTLLNTISQSEFENGVAPAATSVAYEIGQRCRLEKNLSLLSKPGGGYCPGIAFTQPEPKCGAAG